MMNALLQKDLDQLKEAQRLRQLKVRNNSCGPSITIEGVPKLNFCSNDYLGLANDERLIQAAKAAMEQDGFGSGASRLVVGNTDSVERLERDIADLKSVEECLVFNSGYGANTGIIPALMGREDIIFSDKLNHASIVDGCILSRAEVKRYPHLDMGALQEYLKSSAKYRRRLIVTDTVFSMDGDLAPLERIVELAKQHDAWVMVDEAHGFGVLGKTGAGLAEALNVSNCIDVQMGTLSKAAGCFGAYACGARPLKSYLVNHARSFIYTTALPSAVTTAACQAVSIIRSIEGQERRARVLGYAKEVRETLKGYGYDTLQSQTPIIPVVFKEEEAALLASKKLFEAGIHVSAIRPPTVPAHTSRLRITVTAAHAPEDIRALLDAMRQL